MNRLVFTIVVLLIGSGLATAQSPTESALGNRLIAELNASVQCSAELITVKASLAKAEARVKELEPKPEPKTPSK